MRALIRDWCRRNEIPLVGVAGVHRWETPLFTPWVPPAFSPASIFPSAASVIVIGLPVHLPVLDSSPSVWYREAYQTINTLLDQYTYRLASLLTEEGFPSVPVPRDGYGGIEALQKNPVAFFSHRHAAVLAGLGTFGVNNMVLTAKYGPRVRFGSVLTTAAIDEDPLADTPLCTRCNRCVSHCPVQALSPGEYPHNLTNKQTCTANSAELNRHYTSPCGICIRVCPVGEDRIRFNRTDHRIYDSRGADDPVVRSWNHIRRYGTR